MFEAQSRAAWDHTSNLMAAIGSVLGGKAKPADFNPWTAIDAKRGVNQVPLSEERTADLLIASLAPKDFAKHMAEKRRRRKEAREKANGEPKRD